MSTDCLVFVGSLNRHRTRHRDRHADVRQDRAL